MDMETRAALVRVRKAMEGLANETSPDMTMRQLLLLLDVGAMTSPTGLLPLANRHDLSKGTASRIVGQMAGMEGDVRYPDGRDMFKIQLDPHDLRGRLIELSNNGSKALTRFVKALGV